MDPKQIEEEAKWCVEWWNGPVAKTLFDRWGLESEVLDAYQAIKGNGFTPIESLWGALLEWDLLTYTGTGLKIPTTVEEATYPSL